MQRSCRGRPDATAGGAVGVRIAESLTLSIQSECPLDALLRVSAGLEAPANRSTRLNPTLPVTDPVLIVAIAMLIFLAAPRLAEWLGVPGLIGLIVAGAVFGPNGLGILARDATIVLLGTVGLLYLVFLAGLELDLHRFTQFRHQSIVFGLLSFGLPMLLALAFMPMMGFGVAAALLIGSIIGSHTLLAYPIASRLGLVKNSAVTTVVGGTLVTDTLAIATLAVVAGSVGAGIGLHFWVRLLAGLAFYVALVWWAVPRIGRGFFRRNPGQPSLEFVFLMVVLFACAYLAYLAGAQPIIGAFLAGLTLNRLIPNDGPSMGRVQFVGTTLFVPFFLLSVGMLVDPLVLTGSVRVWLIAGTITLFVHVGKLAAALLAQRLFAHSRDEGFLAFGLSLPQAAATLAVTFVGLEIGMFDEDVVNAVVMMIVVTCIVGPSLVDRYGHRVALEEERKPFEPGMMPQRILVPMANPATSEDLIDLALMIREPDSREPIHPLTVVPVEAGESPEQVALAEGMLRRAVTYVAAADTPVLPITRMDHNFAAGISRAALETLSSTVIIGWDGRRSPHRGVFGSVLDQLLELTKQQVLVAKLGHPLNTTRRIVLLVPRGSDHLPGYLQAVRTIKQLANRLGCDIRGMTTDASPLEYEQTFARMAPPAPTTFETMEGWSRMLARLQRELQVDDLVVVMSARRGAVSWVSSLERLPAALVRLVPESFIMMYPSEGIPASARRRFEDEPALPPSLAPTRILYNLPGQSYRSVLNALLETEFGRDRERLREVLEKLWRGDGLSWEILPGILVPHVRLADVQEPVLFLALSPVGIAAPGVEEPARLIFLLLTPEYQPDRHLTEIARIASLVSDPSRVDRMVQARSLEEFLQAMEAAAPAPVET
jgi:Kef-type K+ transport system membrane component KefB